jgi:hypothetical protein
MLIANVCLEWGRWLTDYCESTDDNDRIELPAMIEVSTMPDLVRGPHHCVGIATAVAARIFYLLKTRGEAQRGSLSTADLDLAHADFLAGLSKSADYFESADRQYMQAIGSTAPEYFARESILVTLLIACGHKAARAAFPQGESVGERRLRQLFGGIAGYLRECMTASADERLAEAYFELAVKRGGALRIADLLHDDGIRRVLLECLAPLVAKGADEKLSQPLSDAVTAHIAGMPGIARADSFKITVAEMRKFLYFLPLELGIELGFSAAA